MHAVHMYMYWTLICVFHVAHGGVLFVLILSQYSSCCLRRCGLPTDFQPVELMLPTLTLDDYMLIIIWIAYRVCEMAAYLAVQW